VYQQTVGRIMEVEVEREAMLARAEITAVSAGVNRLIEGYSGLDTILGERRGRFRRNVARRAHRHHDLPQDSRRPGLGHRDPNHSPAAVKYQAHHRYHGYLRGCSCGILRQQNR